jgi:hypothetical protein
VYVCGKGRGGGGSGCTEDAHLNIEVLNYREAIKQRLYKCPKLQK